jgi:hypothetical protein
MTRPLRILTWHVHGNYLWYLSHVAHEIVLPVKPGRPHGYGGRAGAFPWPDTVREVPVDRLADEQVDAVVYQAHDHWLVDRHEVLSPAQRAVPQIVVEPPSCHTDVTAPGAAPPAAPSHRRRARRRQSPTDHCPRAVSGSWWAAARPVRRRPGQSFAPS